MPKKIDVFKEQNSDCYTSSESGRVLIRGTVGEKCPMGNPIQGLWILKDEVGNYIDHNRYRNDLACEHGLTLTRADR